MAEIKVKVPQSLLDDETKKIIKKNDALQRKVDKLQRKINENERKFALVSSAMNSIEALADELRGAGFGEDYHDWGA